MRKRLKKKTIDSRPHIFLDSGAYSAFTKNVKIDIDEYINFIKEYEQFLEVYATLDNIKDPEITYQNQKYMESKGLKPLPCFHYKEPVGYLERYLNEGYDYIALGGMVPISTRNLIEWLDVLFDKFLTNDVGKAIIKVHGFGLTSIPLVLRYPWFSIDSTSWIITGSFGAVFVPVFINNVYDYTKIPHKISVSDKSSKRKETGQHYNTLSNVVRNQIDKYFDLKGFTFKELSTDYMKRDELNIIYFLDLEKNLSDRIFNKSLVKKGFF